MVASTASTACSHVHENALSHAIVVASMEHPSSSSNSTCHFQYLAPSLITTDKKEEKKDSRHRDR
jgi:hypothetical protein